MATRRHAREWAVQLLFQLDLNPSAIDGALKEFWSTTESDSKSRDFAEKLVRGVCANREQIDEALSSFTSNWELHRIGVVERNVMRMSIFELLYCDDVPAVVSINEAVDLAKFFSVRESGRFVNGVLDRARKELISKGDEPSAVSKPE
jgi:N utilization substance protein B